ncbi:Vesicle transport protein, Got1/SFT2-like protein [Senna tora]|uniref:Vesicle transport protein, Got1/SFT2-like protein n=1 Tax=Senna tora TaxID=362788 RepID=A0A834TUT4_9FABA|nr:Vesicle transport protein, Got1/SFT2-like protein [Senna tora]
MFRRKKDPDCSNAKSNVFASMAKRCIPMSTLNSLFKLQCQIKSYHLADIQKQETAPENQPASEDQNHHLANHGATTTQTQRRKADQNTEKPRRSQNRAPKNPKKFRAKQNPTTVTGKPPYTALRHRPECPRAPAYASVKTFERTEARNGEKLKTDENASSPSPGNHHTRRCVAVQCPRAPSYASIREQRRETKKQSKQRKSRPLSPGRLPAKVTDGGDPAGDFRRLPTSSSAEDGSPRTSEPVLSISSSNMTGLQTPTLYRSNVKALIIFVTMDPRMCLTLVPLTRIILDGQNIQQECKHFMIHRFLPKGFANTSSLTPPRDIRTNFLPKAVAIEDANDVFPTPGAPVQPLSLVQALHSPSARADQQEAPDILVNYYNLVAEAAFF